MPLVLPRDYPARGALRPAEARGGTSALRVGVLNIMPRLEEYEPLLLRRLGAAPVPVEPVFLRLETHGYTSSDRAHLDRFYDTFARAGQLDGLILTGAPVEELDFEAVHYWRELSGILERARTSIRSTLGVCWGGMALGALLDVPKRLFPKKLFGVFAHDVLAADDPLLPREDGGTLLCAQSRHSGCDDDALDRAARAGGVRVLASSKETGHTVFASSDHRFVAHLGHPEYESERIAFEWDRDRAAGRADVEAPHGFSVSPPAPDGRAALASWGAPTPWRADSERFFARWLRLLA